MSDSVLYTPHAAVEQLGISPEQLRAWTKEFAPQLSATAIGTGYYRYNAADIKRLQAIKQLLAQGQSATDIARQFNAPLAETPATEPEPAHTTTQTDPASMVIQSDDETTPDAAMLVLREVLQGFAAGQESILNSQQANRNLIGVVIQDNFNLKEENARLRERMLKLEQDLNEIRKMQLDQRHQWAQWTRQATKQDWLSRLFGI